MNSELFKAIRLEKQMTQDDFARLLGISRSTVQMIEAGKRRITDRVRMRLAKHFDLTPEFMELYERANKLTPPNDLT
ncbi:helix-turn-helix transcriptional regulator [Geobacillus subterraneus]|uniref:helix-turn-helix transcriptional regulator n=1 Tax=Geobacillus subterraneus TaxID=129338 RepID=UPI001617FEE1